MTAQPASQQLADRVTCGFLFCSVRLWMPADHHSAAVSILVVMVFFAGAVDGVCYC